MNEGRDRMSIVKRIGLAAVAVTACVTGVFTATGFGEGGGKSSGFSYLSGEGARIAAQDHGAGWAQAAGRGGRKPKVIVIFRRETVPPGQSSFEAGKCPKRSVAVNGLFGPDEFGVNMQGFAGTTPRTWGFQFENETGEPVSTGLGVVCLKNVKLNIRER
jgi:hypothetical protein